MNRESRKCQNCHQEFWIEPDDFSAKGGSQPEADAPQEHASGGDFYHKYDE